MLLSPGPRLFIERLQNCRNLNYLIYIYIYCTLYIIVHLFVLQSFQKNILTDSCKASGESFAAQREQMSILACWSFGQKGRLQLSFSRLNSYMVNLCNTLRFWMQTFMTNTLREGARVWQLALHGQSMSKQTTLAEHCRGTFMAPNTARTSVLCLLCLAQIFSTIALRKVWTMSVWNEYRSGGGVQVHIDSVYKINAMSTHMSPLTR